ncbi:Ig-like domain-containing protein [Clostridium sp. CS001]|uniref:Ig-like domain-containing protein n=1 Tax=Clostridium sp. CS001 TaxID=2880648 RepID=UPI001CF46399|nr:Ig-like domain-containing protein [Clostridium sp. CS001]MCB2289756.1 Ig-like domain-containing protein [Clostridium sp. CS001]
MKTENLFKKIIVSLMVSIFIMGTIISQVSAKEIELEQKTNVPTNKVWNVKLTQSISTDGLSSKVTVADSAGTVIPTDVTVGADGKTIIVTPKKDYEGGKTYTLSVLAGIVSKDKVNSLKDTVKMNFTVSKTASNPVSEIDANSNMGVYLNGVKINYPASGIQPKFLGGIVYLPLEETTKAMKFDTKVSTTVRPNVIVTTSTGVAEGSFNSPRITTATELLGLSGKITASADSAGKYNGCYVPLDFFEVGLGFKVNYKMAKADGTPTNVTHIITLDGTLGTGGTVSGDDPSIDDFKLVPNTPSIKKNAPEMANLQALVKSIPKRDVIDNTFNCFEYDNGQTVIRYKEYLTYSELKVMGELKTNPVGSKIVSTILYDLLGEKDGAQLNSILNEYNSKFELDDAIIAKYLNFQPTASKQYQFKITHDYREVYLELK